MYMIAIHAFIIITKKINGPPNSRQPAWYHMHGHSFQRDRIPDEPHISRSEAYLLIIQSIPESSSTQPGVSPTFMPTSPSCSTSTLVPKASFPCLIIAINLRLKASILTSASRSAAIFLAASCFASAVKRGLSTAGARDDFRLDIGLLSGASLRLDFLLDEDETGLWTDAIEALLWSRLCVPIREGIGEAQREE